MTSTHPDSPRDAEPDDGAVEEASTPRQEDLGHPKLDEELDRDELSGSSPPGQNSDWMPQ